MNLKPSHHGVQSDYPWTISSWEVVLWWMMLMLQSIIKNKEGEKHVVIHKQILLQQTCSSTSNAWLGKGKKEAKMHKINTSNTRTNFGGQANKYKWVYINRRNLTYDLN